MRTPNYDKFPEYCVKGHDDDCVRGWENIGQRLAESIAARDKAIVVVERYVGVLDNEVLHELVERLKPARVINTSDIFLPEDEVDALVQRDVTDDPVFGYLTSLRINDFFNNEALQSARAQAAEWTKGVLLIYGTGASIVHEGDLLIYADLARWEAQMRFRNNKSSNLGVSNYELKWSLKYKQAYFVDWRVCDKIKKRQIDKWDFVLDTNVPGDPKLATGQAVRQGFHQVLQSPFRVVPFFDPAPWGGQRMKEVCDLDRSISNYGWCFDCVPEENSVYLRFGSIRIELPSINLVFYRPEHLMGPSVTSRFGTEFPIRFDFLDTIGGGNLSFQVHPQTEYALEHFGIHYTQDEGYYILDAGPEACVYLGVTEEAVPDEVARDLINAQEGVQPFPAEKHVNIWPAKKHDHFLIPAGTPHCSGKDSMVLEISATPYIFTFKMWDWGRLGLDGRPRPVHLQHGIPNIRWDRRTAWVEKELVNAVTPVAEGMGWREEKTGLHETEFIETRRHWFSSTVVHNTNGGVNVLNLIEGEEAIVESPEGNFAPYVVHYAETFIVPATVGAYTIRPHGLSQGKQCATLKAFVRSSA